MEHPILVVCSVASENSLLKQSKYLESMNIDFKLFREPDMDNQATALGTAPISKTQKHIFNKYMLWDGKLEKNHDSDRTDHKNHRVVHAAFVGEE